LSRGCRYLLIHGQGQIHVYGECEGETDDFPVIYRLGGDTGPFPFLCPMHAVMEKIRYTIREVTSEGNLGVFVCTSGSLNIYPSLQEF
jgi:hypothetical protein